MKEENENSKKSNEKVDKKEPKTNTEVSRIEQPDTDLEEPR